MAGQVVECIACGHVGATRKKGSTFVLILLLLFFFPIGILYWLLNRTGGGVCSACKSQNVRLYVPKPQILQQPVNQFTQAQNKASSGRTKLVAHDAFSYNAGKHVQFDENGVEQKNCPDCRELIRFDARKCKHCGSVLEEAP